MLDTSARDPSEVDIAVREAVSASVSLQLRTGLDLVNDGEMGKLSYATYVTQRLRGFGGPDAGDFPSAEAVDFPEYALRRASGPSRFRVARPACDAPISARDPHAVQRDIEHLKYALSGAAVEEAFLSAASPGVIALFFPNEYYATREDYLDAIANAMRPEYEAIAAAGFVLQLDCPDLAGARHMFPYADQPLSEFLRAAEQSVAALNAATQRIPADQLRMHVCWGNYEGPHLRDVPLEDIVSLLFTARPNAISLEAANPRHEHEWAVFERVQPPPEKVLVPGVIDSTTNFVEHPELVAQRLTRFAETVGPERVIAGVDCGFASAAGWSIVDPRIVWAKLAALAEGAQIASQRLFA